MDIGDDMLDWSNTKEALAKFMDMLNCTLCSHQLPQDACSFQLCDHYFCKECALNLVNDSKSCPQCNAVLWKEHMQESLKIPEVISICEKIKSLIFNKDESEGTAQPKQQDINTYVFDSLPPEQDSNSVVPDSEFPPAESDMTENVQKNEADKNTVKNGETTSKTNFTAVQDCKKMEELTIDVDLKSDDGSMASPLESPPMSSQFSNIITKSEIRNGVQKNPRRLVKRPKVTYGRKKRAADDPLNGQFQENEKTTSKSSAIVPRALVPNNSEEVFSVFDFSSGTSESELVKNEGKKVKDANKNNKVNSVQSKPPKKRQSKANARERKRRSSLEKPSVGEPSEGFKEKTDNKEPTKVKKKAQVEKKNTKGETPLHAACIKGNLTRVKELIEQGAQTNTKDFAGWTPLHEACNHGFKEIVELLLDNRAIIDCVAGEDNDTPLHDAVSSNRLEVVQLLLKRNAPTNVRNRVGLLPEDYSTTEEMKNSFKMGKYSIDAASVLDESRFDESIADEEKVFVTTNIKQTEKGGLEKCCKLLGGRLLKDFDKSVTHVICGVTEEDLSITRTLKYWNGILHGKWLVSYKWVEESQQKKRWLKEADYEVKGTIDAPYEIPRKARINRLKMLPKLFDGCSFYMAGSYDVTLPRKTIVGLVKLGGGKILSREPKTSDVDPLLTPITSDVNKLDILPTHIQPTVIFHARDTSSQACCTQYIIYDEKKEPAYTRVFSPVLCSTTVSWILDCISNFEILDIKESHDNGDDFNSSQS